MMSKEMIVRLNEDRVKIKGCEYVQDLVRCEDCCHRRLVHKTWMCLFGLMIKGPDGFCNYGEREEAD